MKILTIEKAIKFEISDALFDAIETKNNFVRSAENDEEIHLVGTNLTEKGAVLHRMITVLAARITESFSTKDLDERMKFSSKLAHRLITSQTFLANLTQTPVDLHSYWELIDLLGETISFHNGQVTRSKQTEKSFQTN